MQPDTVTVDAGDRRLAGIVAAIAKQTNRPERDLLRRALLELPRVAGADGTACRPVACRLIRDLALEMPASESWSTDTIETSPRQLIFGPLRREHADLILERFHYLRSSRPDAEHFALFNAGARPVAVFSVSPVDVASLKTIGEGLAKPAVLSRVFGFADLPRNSISFGLAALWRHIRLRGIDGILTYLNPNLGFSGTSYTASGWSLAGSDPLTAYSYCNSRYRSERQIARGECDGPFSQSVMSLQPLLVYRRSADLVANRRNMLA